MITKILIIPPVMCYVVVLIGAICMFYTGIHKGEFNEFLSSHANVDNTCYEITDIQKEQFSGRSSVELRNGENTLLLEQDYEGSSTYHTQDRSTAYTRIGDSFIKR